MPVLPTSVEAPVAGSMVWISPVLPRLAKITPSVGRTASAPKKLVVLTEVSVAALAGLIFLNECTVSPWFLADKYNVPSGAKAMLAAKAPVSPTVVASPVVVLIV